MGTYDWLPPIKKAVTRNGKMHAMPVNSGAQAFIYNTELYQKVGLDPAKPPTTFDQVLEYAAKVGASADQVWGHYVLTAPNSQTGSDYLPAALWAYGAREVSEDGTKVAFNTPEAAVTLQWYKDLIAKKGTPVKKIDEVQMLNDYLTGAVGSMFVYPAVVARVGRGQLQERVSPLPGRSEGAADAAWIRHDHGDGQGEESRRRLGVRQVHRPRSEQRRLLEHQLRPATAAPVVPRRSGLEGVRGQEPARSGLPRVAEVGRPALLRAGQRRRSGPSLARRSRRWSSARRRPSKRWRKRPRRARRSWTASARRPADTAPPATAIGRRAPVLSS